MRTHGTPAGAKPAAAKLAAGNASDAGPEWMKQLRKYSKQLLAFVGTVDAVAVSGRIIDELPVKMVRELSAACESDTFVADTLAEFPEFTATPARREYFTALLTAVQGACTSGDDPEEDELEDDGQGGGGAPSEENAEGQGGTDGK